MSSGKQKNQMQETANTNLCQADEPDLPNNVKSIHPRQTNEGEVKTIDNNLTNPLNTAPCGASNENTQELQCDAEGDGKCEGKITKYNHLHFNCLAAKVPGQPSTHNFCKYHYDNATVCPVHPCFNRTYF